jgi:cysteinyl-tRNA synthetase
MRRQRTMVATILAAGALMPFAGVTAQVPPTQQAQQQLQRMQEQVQRLNESMHRMTRIQEHAQAMEQTMLREMEQLRALEHLQVQDRERLQHQEQIHTMAQAMSGAAGEMVRAMVGLREMAESPGGIVTQEMEREMERLQQHLRETCDQMEAGLSVMEQLRERLAGS